MNSPLLQTGQHSPSGIKKSEHVILQVTNIQPEIKEGFYLYNQTFWIGKPPITISYHFFTNHESDVNRSFS